MIKQFSILNRIDNVGYLTYVMYPHFCRLLIWSLQLEKSQYMSLCARIMVIWKSNGQVFLVHYLKESVRIVQAYVSGHPILHTNEAIVGLVGGLPSIIPGTLRSSIRSRDLETIRGILSMLQVYRVLSIPGKLKLGTITDPFNGLSETLPKYEIMKAISEISHKRDILKPITLRYLSTAGPNHPTSMLGIWKDLIAWRESPLLPVLFSFISKFPGSEVFTDLIKSELEYLSSAKNKDYKLGKLSKKEEAAGKIRIFAITDSITQSVMSPLSDFIFKILRSIPMDGTFNQDGPLKRLVLRSKENLIMDQEFYSYDLSAATDRLPISVQKQVLSCFFGDSFAEEWGILLTNRDWYLDGIPFRYSVGQPMGALSSWAMLALTHHVIVKIAARRVSLYDFTDYAVLGDDVVIANKAVATVYHNIMTEVLGVSINLSKSLVSSDSFEFAKRLITLDGEVSPVGAKNLLVGLKSMKGLPSILLDLQNKGVALSEESVTSMYKSVPTVRKSQLERLSWLVKGPFGFVPTVDGLSASLKLTNSLSAVMMDSLLSSIDEALHKSRLKTWESNVAKAGRVLFSLRNIHAGSRIDFDLSSSPLLREMLSNWVIKTNNLILEKPVRRLIFDGPLVFTNYYRASWMLEMMSYIKSKLQKNDLDTKPILDPFKVDSVILPLSLNKKAENFWQLVKEIENEKSSIRGFKGW